MYRFILTLLALSITLGMSASTVYAGSSVAHPSWPRSLRDDLTERVRLDPGAVSLSKGTELVVLDLKVSGDQVRLFTHTLDPVPLPGGKVGHGCTEFVFAFDPGTLNRANLGAIAGRIDAVLTRNSNG